MSGRMNMVMYKNIRKVIEDRGVVRTDDIATALHLTYKQAHSRLRQYVYKGLIFRAGNGLYVVTQEARTAVGKSTAPKRRRKRDANSSAKLLVKCFNKMVTVK